MLRRSRGPSACLSLCTSAVLAAAAVGCAPQPDDVAPNILMVLVDDLGYTDFGAYGGNAATPTVDALAQDGVQFSNHHAYPVCAPSRAALLTGQDPHQVGLGSMEGLAPPGVPTTTPGYRGSLEGSFTGIAKVLSDAGYSTYQVGKWHLGDGPGQTPRELGFQHNFTLYDGAASHYEDKLRLAPSPTPPRDTAHYERNGQLIETLPDGFYSTDAYTDELMGFIDQEVDQGKPFFGYLGYTAVHDPLHVPDTELINRYLEQYLDANNFNDLRAQRIAALADRGLIAADVATRWPSQTPDWDTLSPGQRRDLAHRFAVYDAMIEDTDKHLGRLVNHLKQIGEYDNTLIVVTSDNGAAGATRRVYAAMSGGDQWQREHYPLIGDVEAYGRPGSFPSLGLANAQVSSGPYFHTKATVFEGGTRVPLIIKPPGGGSDPRRVDTLTQLTDMYPTFAEFAGVTLPQNGALAGDSLKPLLDGVSDQVGDDELGMELFGLRAYRDGDWKIVYAPTAMGGTGRFALYNLRDDPGETVDLAAAHPETTRELAQKWDVYAARNGVIPVPFETVEAASGISTLMFAADWAD